ncbi:hypothetical protein HQ529_01295 [Candidatus Woesearchaeota archaeon]|nr:hypothetical protein [Candidatus Woesearchaeota archaeon]
MKKLFMFLLFLLVVSSVSANDGHIKLLAVTEANGVFSGSVADLYLETRPGSGAVFIETFPLTKIDTQISTRFAKEIACKHLDLDCDNQDFFYVIRAGHSIVGGPSAGAAIAVLTVSVLDNLEIDETVAVTGTINSGGIIGPVAGLKEKIEAAFKNGIKKVLVPKAETIFSDENETNLTAFGYELGIEVVSVSELDDALFEFSGKRYQKDVDLIISETYEKTMRMLAEDLCDRSKYLKEKVDNYEWDEDVSKAISDINNISMSGETSFNKTKYYSSASFCFGANVGYKHMLLILQNHSVGKIVNYTLNIKKIAEESNKRLKAMSYETLTDLEAYMIVKQRLIEAVDFANDASKNIIAGNINNALYDLAYAQERIYTARSWSEFFDEKGKEFELNKENVRKSCLKKILEVEERFQYIELFIPFELEEVKKQLSRAYDDLDKEDYELCLFKATKSKAEIDSILSVLGLDEDNAKIILDKKLDIARRSIAKEINNGVFPILAYSYYEYADSLREEDVYSSLLYSEYALGMSDLDIYFKERKRVNVAPIDMVNILFFASGLFFGLYMGFLIKLKKLKKSKN